MAVCLAGWWWVGWWYVLPCAGGPYHHQPWHSQLAVRACTLQQSAKQPAGGKCTGYLSAQRCCCCSLASYKMPAYWLTQLYKSFTYLQQLAKSSCSWGQLSTGQSTASTYLSLPSAHPVSADGDPSQIFLIPCTYIPWAQLESEETPVKLRNPACVRC